MRYRKNLYGEFKNNQFKYGPCIRTGTDIGPVTPEKKLDLIELFTIKQNNEDIMESHIMPILFDIGDMINIRYTDDENKWYPEAWEVTGMIRHHTIISYELSNGKSLYPWLLRLDKRWLRNTKLNTILEK